MGEKWPRILSKVATEICTTSIKYNNKGLAIAGVVICRPLIKETQILSQFNPYGICGGNIWHWDRFLSQ